MGIAEEMKSWGGDPRMDHGYRQRTPGYREYANQVIDDMGEGYVAGSGIPVLADAAGLNMDYKMFRDEPETRTPWNFAWAGAAAALPFIPNVAGTIRRGVQNIKRNKNAVPQTTQVTDDMSPGLANIIKKIESSAGGGSPQAPSILKNSSPAEPIPRKGFTAAEHPFLDQPQQMTPIVNNNYPPRSGSVPGWHGTHANDINEFNRNKGDFGIHMGTTPEQANIRLDNKWGLRDSDGYSTPVSNYPVNLNTGNSIRMDDGNWGDMDAVLGNLIDHPMVAKNTKLFDALNEMEAAGIAHLPGSQGDIMNMMKKNGIDSIVYKNSVETPDIPGIQNKLDRRQRTMNMQKNDLVASQGGLPPRQGGIQPGLQHRPEDSVKMAFLRKRHAQMARTSRQNEDSVIMMDPSDIRSIYAKNDPAQRKSGNIMAGFAGLGLTGLAGKQMMGEDDGVQ